MKEVTGRKRQREGRKEGSDEDIGKRQSERAGRQVDK